MTTDGETWAIDARGLTKTFGTVTVVRGVTLQMASGTIFAFLDRTDPANRPPSSCSLACLLRRRERRE